MEPQINEVNGARRRRGRHAVRIVKKSELVWVRVTPEFKSRLVTGAYAQNVPLCEYIRRCLEQTHPAQAA